MPSTSPPLFPRKPGLPARSVPCHCSENDILLVLFGLFVAFYPQSVLSFAETHMSVNLRCGATLESHNPNPKTQDGLFPMVNLIIPDKWQQDALNLLREGTDVVVQAPTGAGKTYIFELFYESLRGQAIYTVPTRALANDKLAEWRARGWDVGISTGDLAENLGSSGGCRNPRDAKRAILTTGRSTAACGRRVPAPGRSGSRDEL